MVILLFFISLLGGFLSGFLGLGGAVVIIPFMLTIPPLFGLDALSVKTVAGLSMIQVFSASLSSLIIHKRNMFIHWKFLFFTGIPMALFSFTGSFISKYMHDTVIMTGFVILLLMAFIALLYKIPEQNPMTGVQDIYINPLVLILTGSAVGFISGVVGAGGGFILVPLMIVFMKIPIKITVGTSMGIVFMGAVFGALGKIVSLQVDYILVIPVVAGSLIAARQGAKLCKHIPDRSIHHMLMVVIFISILQIILKLL